MKLQVVIAFTLLLAACQALAPVDSPINSCRLIESATQSGGMFPGDMQEYSQCEYLCPNGQTKTHTQFGSCSPFIGP